MIAASGDVDPTVALWRFFRLVVLFVVELSPAIDFSSMVDRAAVMSARCDLGVDSLWRACLKAIIKTPANQTAVAGDGTGR